MSGLGAKVGDAVSKGVGMFHGTGEAIRGNVNAAVDSAAGDKQSAAKNEEIASRGAHEFDKGYHRNHATTGTTAGTGATGTGVAGAPSEVTTNQPLSQSEYGTQPVGSTGYANDTQVPPRANPAYDSELALRRTQTDGSSNYGPHSTNVGNKLDPRYDSDLDHRGPGRYYPDGPYEPDAARRASGPPYSYNTDPARSGPGSFHDPDASRRGSAPHHSDSRFPPGGAGTEYRCNKCGCTSFGLYNIASGHKVESGRDLDRTWGDERRPRSRSPPYDRPRPGETDMYRSDPDTRDPEGRVAAHMQDQQRRESEAERRRSNPGQPGHPGHGVNYGNEGPGGPPRPVHNSALLNRLDPRVDSETGMRKF